MDIISSVLINFNGLYKHTLMKKNFEYLYKGYSIQIVMQEKKIFEKNMPDLIKLGNLLLQELFVA